LKRTVAEFARQLEAEPWVGITRCQGVEFLEAPSAAYTRQTAESFEDETGINGYRILCREEVPDGVELGFEYPSFCVNAPLYCANLLRRFLARGGKTLQRDLRSEWEVFSLRPRVKFAVNASGTGFGDTKCFPTRGASHLPQQRAPIIMEVTMELTEENNPRVNQAKPSSQALHRQQRQLQNITGTGHTPSSSPASFKAAPSWAARKSPATGAPTSSPRPGNV
jgi:hypothetical protein